MNRSGMPAMPAKDQCEMSHVALVRDTWSYEYHSSQHAGEGSGMSAMPAKDPCRMWQRHTRSIHNS
jgi:hypothetical protein